VHCAYQFKVLHGAIAFQARTNTENSMSDWLLEVFGVIVKRLKFERLWKHDPQQISLGDHKTECLTASRSLDKWAKTGMRAPSAADLVFTSMSA